MKEFTIGKNDAGQRLDRWLAKSLPLLPAPLAQKYIRLKRVKVNGKGSKRDVRLSVGDRRQLYINDEFFDRPTPENAFLSLYQPKLNILYEDEEVIVCEKPAGVAAQTKRLGQADMESLLKNYRAGKGEQPYIGVVHRLDQPVRGVMVA